MSTISLAHVHAVATTRFRPTAVLSGPKFPILFAAALPAAVMALACGGPAQRLGALIAIGWFSLVPLALYNCWVAVALPVVAAAFLAMTLGALAAVPVGSTPLTVDLWTAAVLLLLSLPPPPRRRPAPDHPRHA